MNILQKFKETLSSVLPIMVIVLILGLTVTPIGLPLICRFLFSGLLVVVGLTIFLLGIDIGVLPIGEQSGAALTAKRNLPLLLSVSFVIGFMVTIAEPDVQVLADQMRNVDPNVNRWMLIFMIAAGVGLFVMLGVLRVIVSIPLRVMLIVSYVIVFILAFLSPLEFQGVAFDSGGATTGPMTVPFIMALGTGIAAVRSRNTGGKSSKQDDSFGFTGLASIGPIAAVCLYGIILAQTGTIGSSSSTEVAASVSEQGFGIFIQIFPSILHEVAAALAPLLVMFILFQLFLLKMPPVQVLRMIKGLVYSFVGLCFFLVGAKGGFMPAGERLGEVLGSLAVNGAGGVILLLIVGFLFGGVVVCAEPAVWVLTDQVESISGGTIKRRVMLGALSAGVAVSIALAMLRVLYGFSLWYILVPGYALALVLTFFCPTLFTGIGFDSGGVASGPMTSTFILSFTLGASKASGGNPATDAFGVIALVALTPLIAIQILGIIFKYKNSRAVTSKKKETIS